MRWGIGTIVVFIAMGMFTPAPILAADKPKDEASKEHKDGKDHKDDKDHKSDGKEKPLDLFKGWIDLTVWTIAVFLVLFFVLNTFAWPQIRAGLDKREAAIAHDKHEAVKAKKEADELRVSLQAELAKANDQIRTMIDKARADAQATANEELARGKAELAAEKSRLREEMSRAKDQALQEVWSQGANLATLISGKTIRKNLSVDDHRALVDEALKEFRAAAQARLEDLTSARA